MYASTSAINYWQVERERGPLDGGRIVWDDYLRIRHAVTRQYLYVVDTQAHSVQMTSVGTGTHTLFRFFPVVKVVSFIILASLSVQTDRFINFSKYTVSGSP